ncbi:unnamed protein product [Cochlearia groenlandica]
MDDAKDAPPVSITRDQDVEVFLSVQADIAQLNQYAMILEVSPGTSQPLLIEYNNKGKEKVVEEEVVPNDKLLRKQDIECFRKALEISKMKTLPIGFEIGELTERLIAEEFDPVEPIIWESPRELEPDEDHNNVGGDGMFVGRIFKDKSDFRLRISMNAIQDNTHSECCGLHLDLLSLFV